MATYVKGDAVENATAYELYEKTDEGYELLAEAEEINFEVSALGLYNGDHTLVVKAKADGYAESEYSNAVVYTETNGEDAPTTTMATNEFMDTVGTTYGTYRYDGSTVTTVSSEAYRTVVVDLSVYDIQSINCITGIATTNNVAPLLFLSGSTISAANILGYAFGASNTLLTHSSFYVYSATLADVIPSGTTHIAFSEFINLETITGSANLEAFKEIYTVTYYA